MSEVLVASTFQPYVGRIVRFKGTRFAFPLDEIVVGEGGRRGPTREPFILLFHGPREKEYLPEGSYECEFEDGPTFTLYLTPIHTVAPDRQDYQAAFN